MKRRGVERMGTIWSGVEGNQMEWSGRKCNGVGGKNKITRSGGK